VDAVSRKGGSVSTATAPTSGSHKMHRSKIAVFSPGSHFVRGSFEKSLESGAATNR
jgi:hypothetical protein